jgi:hypothetical protein
MYALHESGRLALEALVRKKNRHIAEQGCINFKNLETSSKF